jgi:uncharacterized protein
MSADPSRVVIEFEPEAAALVDRIKREQTAAQRAGDTTRLNTLRLLRAAIDNLAIARTDPKRPDYQRPITVGDLYTLVDQQRKAREEAATLYERGGRADRAAQERREGEILAEFRPAQMDRAAIAAAVQEVIAEVGPTFRAVMPRAAQTLRGRADGKVIQEVVRELTQG